MAQAQLDAANFLLQSDDFLNVLCEFSQRRIRCSLDNNTCLIIKRTRKDTYIFLRKGKTCIKLNPEIYELICDAKVSVSFLRSFLEQNT